jgi:hypothetical protein
VRNSAGWAQLNLRTPSNQLGGGAGCGSDLPNVTDVVADLNSRRSNTTCAVYSIWRPAGPVFLGAEARRTQTKYRGPRFTNNHFNLALGFEF